MSDIRDFGAAGDGTRDDTAAIRHALSQGDGVLQLPPGTYRISETIQIDLAGGRFVGIAGAEGTARIVMAGAGPALRLVGTHQGSADPEEVSVPVWAHERFPMVTGLEIVGDHPQADGIELTRTMQPTIERTLIRQVRHGIRLSVRNRNVLINACHIYDNHGVGIFLDRCNLHQMIISACHISYNRQAGIKSLGGDVHNLQITGNDVEYNYDRFASAAADDADAEPGAADIWFDARGGIASEITIASNTIQARVSSGGANLRVYGQPDATGRNSARLIAVTGNVLGSQNRNVEMRWAERVTISGNTIYDGRRAAIEVSDGKHIAVGCNTFGWALGPEREMSDSLRFRRCVGVNVTGLVLRASRGGDPHGGGAVSFEQVRDSAVSGCQIIGPRWRGVTLTDAQRCRVSENTIVDDGEGPAMLTAVELQGDCTDTLVRQNLLGRGQSGAIRNAASGAMLDGNHTIN